MLGAFLAACCGLIGGCGLSGGCGSAVGQEADPDTGLFRGVVSSAQGSDDESAQGDWIVSDGDFARRSRVLFNERSLAGWEGDGFWFHINEDAIVAGRLDRKIPENRFLMTREVFGDFDLRLDVRMVGPAEGPMGNNAGVQFRSRRPRAGETAQGKPVPKHEMVGYQADMGSAMGRSVWGALYDESRRRTMLAEPEVPYDVPYHKVTRELLGRKMEGETDADGLAKSAADEKSIAYRETDWVKMRILCVGRRIRIFLNDTKTVDYTETDEWIDMEGHIALQIHSGPPAEAWYRNIRILMR